MLLLLSSLFSNWLSLGNQWNYEFEILFVDKFVKKIETFENQRLTVFSVYLPVSKPLEVSS